MRIIAEVSETTRKIKLPIDRVLSVNGDYQVDEIAFKLPDTYEGDFDFRTGVPRVHWKGADGAEHAEVLVSVDSSGRPLWVLPAALTQGGDGVIEFSVSFSTTDASDHLTQRWKSKPAAFRNERGIGGNDEQAEDDEIYDRLASAVASVRAAQAEVEDTNAVLSSLTGSAPVPVENRSDMVDNGHLYLYTGDETSFVAGNLYYYVNGTLTNGGPYGAVTLDDTLTQSGQAADAAAVGEALGDIDADVTQIKEDLSDIQMATTDDVGKALKAKTVTNGKVTEWEFGEAGGGGLTNAVKQALLACFQNVAWANANGETYYNDLISAFTEGGGGGEETPLYPMTDGSKTFVNGMAISVTNGNHVDITGLRQGEWIWNLSDIASNNSDSSLSANSSSVNNLPTTMFSIPSGSRVEIKILNITQTRTDVFGAQTGGGKQLILNMRKTGEPASAFSSLIYPAGGVDVLELTTTLTESLDLSCVLMYASGTRGDRTVDISFDLAVYVDGVRWI